MIESITEVRRDLAMTDQQNHSRKIGLILVLFLLTLTAYSNCWMVPFHFDDQIRIAEDRSIRTLWPLYVPMRYSTRPFANYTFAINYAIHGLDVRGFHLTNVAIHFLAGVFLYGALRRILLLCNRNSDQFATMTAFAIASLWLVHPIQTQAVTYIVQRLESMMGMCYLGTIYFFLRAVASKTPRGWYAMSALLCALGMGSKEVMVTAPILVLWLDRAFVEPTWKSIFEKRLSFYLALASTWGILAWSMLHYREEYTNGALVSVEGLNSWNYLLSQSSVIVHYLRLVAWPSGLCFHYQWPITESLDEVWPQALFLTTALGMTIVALFVAPRWGFVGGWFFLILGLTSSIIPTKDLAFEHRMYLPSIAVLALGVLTVQRCLDAISSRTVQRVLSSVIFLAVLAALTLTTYFRNDTYRTRLSLMLDTTQKAPWNDVAWTNLGCAYIEEKEIDSARECFERAIQLNPKNDQNFANHGGVLIEQGDTPRAEESLKLALKLNPENELALRNLAQLLLEEKRLPEAIQCFTGILAKKPDDHDSRISLAVAYLQSKQFDLATSQCEWILKNNPLSVEGHVNLACILQQQGKIDAAIDRCQEAIRIDPECSNAHGTLASLLIETDMARAIEHMKEAHRIDPKSIELTQGLARMTIQQNLDEAIPLFREVLEAIPDDVEAHFSLAYALDATGHPREALPHLERVVELMPQWNQAKASLEDLRRRIELANTKQK